MNFDYCVTKASQIRWSPGHFTSIMYSTQTLWSMIWAPYCGLVVKMDIGAWTFKGESTEVKCCRIMVSANLPFVNAKVLANTNPWPSAERQERHLMLQCVWNPPWKSLLACIHLHHRLIFLGHVGLGAPGEGVGLLVEERIPQVSLSWIFVESGFHQSMIWEPRVVS